MPARRMLIAARRMSRPGRRPHPTTTFEVVDDVAVITFDDGKVNAISRQMSQALSDALDVLEASEARALVVAGRPGQFCAGFDLDTLMVGGPRRDDLVLDGWNLLLRLLTLPMPVVVACTGNAVAAGAGLLLAADVRIGADGPFRIGFNEMAIGLPLPGVVLMLIHDRLPEGIWEEATEGARLYSAQEAVDAGFLHRTAAPSELLDIAVADARVLGAGSADEFRRDKEARVGPLAERMRAQLTEDIGLLRRIAV